MATIFFLTLLSAISLVSLVRPWVGVVAAYTIVVMSPQDIWPWSFEGLRPVYWILLPTLAGFAYRVVGGQYRYVSLLQRRNFYLLVLWLCFLSSYAFGPYVGAGGPHRFTDPRWAIDVVNKVFLLYFVASVCLDDERKLRAMSVMLVASFAYFTYWANDQYLSGRVMGARLGGPVDAAGGGIYADENSFGMLFVATMPYAWYGAFLLRKWILRIGLWLVIPLGWHAIFLTGSRGALLGLAAAVLTIVVRSRRGVLAMMLVPALVVAYQWQAGDLMKNRAETISEYDTEESAAGRLDAWQAAIRMMWDRPVVGVGFASFGPAFPDYSDKLPREAHNTFFQIGGESGLIAATMYLFAMGGALWGLRKNGNALRDQEIGTWQGRLFLINEATLAGLMGLFVCSMFLSLQMYELLYCLLLMANGVLFVGSEGNRAIPAVMRPKVPDGEQRETLSQ